MNQLFGGQYNNKRVLITGHTGFKGSWLSFWLLQMNAEVLGYALNPHTHPNHFSILSQPIKTVIGDILDYEKLDQVFKSFQPEIVFHLAAQSLVGPSFINPAETYQTNVMGTVKVLEVCRKNTSVRAVINVTSDKCYENREWVSAYRENDPMGGHDPYSSSKGCAELVAAAYRKSFFNMKDYGIKHNLLLASVRAGIVIGGGDWSKNRIVTDLMEAVSQGKKLFIKSPYSTRLWQHVLDPLSGYLQVGQKLLMGEKEYAESWNFGPKEDDFIQVIEMIKQMQKHWGEIDFCFEEKDTNFHDAYLFNLDCSKARTKLKWKGAWDSSTTFAKTVEWYRNYYQKDNILTKNHLEEYVISAQKADLTWVN
jgi:CDP-glucose 4,6-dehydratase